MNEKELIDKVRLKDKSAFDTLFRLYYKPLCVFSYNMLRDKTLAEEIVQEFFIAIWEQPPLISDSVKPYFYKSIYNRTLNHIEKAKIRFKNKPGKNIQYFVEGNVWYAKNNIVYNAEAVQLNDYLYRTGHQIGQPFLYECIGFFKDATDIANSPIQNFSKVMPGDLKYKDQNNDGIINQQDVFPIGKTDLPDVTYSLHTGITFKGFDFDMLFQGVANRTIYLSGNYYQAFQNNGQISAIALGRWTPATAETATYPRLTASNNLNNFQYSTFWQRNGNFLKLRSLEVGYTLPKQTLSKIKLQNVRVFLSGSNLFEWDKVDYVSDPETLSGYPSVKTMSIGLKIQF